MSDKPYEIIDGKIYPRKTAESANSSDEVVGSYWKIWKEGAKCFLEYDKGSFATKMSTIEISDEDYRLIASKPSSIVEVINSKQGD